MSNLVHNLTNSPNLVERIKGIDRDIDNLESGKQDKLTAGEGISIDENNVISNTGETLEWGNIEGDIHNQTDLMEIVGDDSEILSQGAYDNLPVEKQEDGTLYLIYGLGGSGTEEVPYGADMSLSFNNNTSVLTAGLLDQSGHVLGTPKSVTIPSGVSPEDVNTKTFYISDRNDLTNAQAALDWYLSGKDPIIALDNKRYFVWYKTSSSLWFFGGDYAQQDYGSGTSGLQREGVVILYSGNTVTNVSPSRLTHEINSYLATGINYRTPYNPQYPGSPATKKYVDDKSSTIPSGSTEPSNPTTGTIWYDTTNNIVKIYDGTTWIEIGGNPQSGSTEPVNPQEGGLWYDTVNHILKIYNGTSWETVDTDTNTTYTAGNGINISAQNEISADTTVIATKQYVTDSVASSKSSGSTAPTSPTVGQLWYDTTNNVLKVYDGTNWVEVGGSAASGSTPPSNPTTGTIWYDTTNNVLKVYNGTNWEIVGDSITTIQPQSPSIGTTWYDVTNNEFKIYDGTTWQTVGLSLPTIVNDKYLHTNSSTGELEWSDTPQSTTSWGGISGTLSDQTDLQNALNTIQGNVTVIENQVDTMSINGAASDHLEQAAIVGELYTLDTPMFIQETPTYADATGSQNIGNAAENKQIHIQRIGSGVASSKLKLKIKMVGESSINLSVEVRQGVKTDASATEAWWRGGTLIASGTIPYSSITTSWQDIEVILDNPFGGTRGQLLNVVVKQAGDVVNTTNYYCIGYDESQYGEAYRLVKYNGSTYTRTTDMPYCTSAGFADKLMCKIGSAIETTSTATTITGTASIGSCGSTNFTVRDTTGISGQGIYKIYVTAGGHSTTSGCFVPGTKIYVEGGTKNVEDVTVGDKILSYNLKTGEDEYVDVTYAIKHANIGGEMYRLTTAKGDLLTTGIHPTYVETTDGIKDYLSADRVNVGDKIAITGGQFSEVTSIKTEEYIGDWYNLFTDLNHNYYVGEGFLVANE